MSDVLFYICGVMILIAIIITVIISYACCAMSGRISRLEEQHENDNA